MSAAVKPTQKELYGHQVAGKIVRLLSAYIPEVAMGQAIADLAQHLEADQSILAFDEASPGGICHMGHDWEVLTHGAKKRCVRCGEVQWI